MASGEFQITKDPEAQLDYTFNWASWLTGAETISSVTWNIPSGSGFTQHSSATNTTTAATIFLSGGTVGQWGVECKITTNSTPARVDERTLLIRVKER